MEVSSDAEHFHVHAQEHKVLQFAHRHRPLAAITRVQVLSDHRLAQVELARSLNYLLYVSNFSLGSNGQPVHRDVRRLGDHLLFASGDQVRWAG